MGFELVIFNYVCYLECYNNFGNFLCFKCINFVCIRCRKEFMKVDIELG